MIQGRILRSRKLQGQSIEGGTFEGQLVRWSVKIVQELPSFSLLKVEEDNFYRNLVVYLSHAPSLNFDQSESSVFANGIVQVMSMMSMGFYYDFCGFL